ncbi:sugar phosphotransferase [Pelomyxa schiedti]|nr:sugar phosphotransferase [Pelomyxa schiedti]
MVQRCARSGTLTRWTPHNITCIRPQHHIKRMNVVMRQGGGGMYRHHHYDSNRGRATGWIMGVGGGVTRCFGCVGVLIAFVWLVTFGLLIIRSKIHTETTMEPGTFIVEGNPVSPLNGPDYTAIDWKIKCDVVDVVYTWVNGSDPAHKKLKTKYIGANYFDSGFRDYGVLKYSIRSIEKYLPWARDIILVTNGQIPNWVDPNAPNFRLVTHEEIFKNKTNLPTFNSNAIEANIHNIPGLAPCLLYMNDDMFLGHEVSKEFFFDPRTGIINFFMSSRLAPATAEMKTNKWHASVGFSNSLLNSYYNPETPHLEHHYVGHNCYFMRHDVIDIMYHRWSKNFAFTESHRLRHRNDTALPFLAANVAYAENVASAKYEDRNQYGTWTPNATLNLEWWNRLWNPPWYQKLFVSSVPYCVCLNDHLDNTPQSEEQILLLTNLFESKFPVPSRIERKLP